MHTPPSSVQARNGFTLIELLVVVTIIGIMAGVIGFNMMADDPSRDVRREAERFVLVMRQAVDEATFGQMQLGLYIDDEGYSFGHWEMIELESEDLGGSNPGLSTQSAGSAPGTGNTQLNRLLQGVKPPERVGKWKAVTGGRALRDHQFPDHIRLVLDVPESELMESLNERTESRLTKTNLNLDKIGPKVEEDPGLPTPPVYILSSGELTPFWVTLYYTRDSSIQVKIEADILGRVRVLDDAL